MNVRAATTAARTEPSTPAPAAIKKERNAMPQAIGCRIMTRVRAFAESAEAVEKDE